MLTSARPGLAGDPPYGSDTPQSRTAVTPHGTIGRRLRTEEVFFPPNAESSRLSRQIMAMSIRVGRDPVAVPAFSGDGRRSRGVHRLERPVVDDEDFKGRGASWPGRCCPARAALSRLTSLRTSTLCTVRAPHGRGSRSRPLIWCVLKWSAHNALILATLSRQHVVLACGPPSAMRPARQPGRPTRGRFGQATAKPS